MAKHLNNDIAKVGSEFAVKWLNDHGFLVSADNTIVQVPYMPGSRTQPITQKYYDKLVESGEAMSLQDAMDSLDVLQTGQRVCKLVITTKQYEEKEGEKVTGLDTERIKKLLAAASDEHLEDVFVVFVDARHRLLYGHFLSELMKPNKAFDKDWPMIRITHTGEIAFFSLFFIPTLDVLPEELATKLGHLAAKNRSDKNQTYLF